MNCEICNNPAQPEIVRQSVKTRHGCFGGRHPPYVFGRGTMHEIVTDTCPWAQADASALAAIGYYNFSKDGLLPEAGGVNDQPAKLIDAMVLIGGIMSEKFEKELKDIREKNDR